MGSISTVYGNRDVITKDGYLGIGDGVVRIGLSWNLCTYALATTRCS
jgi:hypothetical protein